MGGLNLSELIDNHGILIAVENVLVIRQGDDFGANQLVKFILNTIPGPDGQMVGWITDMENNVISRQKLAFLRIDEFFALKSYMTRNAISVV